ncbi:MAG TPA: MFS transporter [Steroidobacteraceae bacterium]|nr:MFS transporter [Steroidobacteraceae bacterium]
MNHSVSTSGPLATPAGTPGSSETAETPWPSARTAWYAVGVFALVLAINFLDRGIVTLLVGPIKHDLGLSDTKASLLIGFAFVLFNVMLGLPIARLADTRSRRVIIGTGLAVWSTMTALCGLARTYAQLFIARVGVGVGEACNGPATFSMLSDLFPPAKLPRAIAVMNFGFVGGTGLALLLGGTVLHFVSGMPPVSLPLVGVLHPWQITFILVGIPGLFVAGLLATVPEPVRRGRLRHVQARAMPVRDVLRYLFENRSTYGPMFLGLAFNVVLSFGNQAWIPTFLVRTYGWSASQAGIVQGLVVICTAPFGLLSGSLLAEWFTRRGYADANMRVTCIGIGCGIPCGIAYPLMPTPQLAVAVLTLQFFFAMLLPGPLNAALQIVTPNQIRGQVTALFLFVFNAVGFGIGPTWIAALTDYVFRQESMLRYSLLVSTALMGPLAVLTMLYGIRSYAESVKRASRWA